MTEQENEADVNSGIVQDSIPDLMQQLSEATQKAQANWEMLLRKEAECQNIQRRAAQEVDNASKFAIERLASELLQVVDNFERAFESLATISDSDENKDQNKNLQGFTDGIKLTYKILLDSLEKCGVTQINPLGEAFDPQFHEALSAQENVEVTPDTVVSVYAKGYLLKGRLLRPARVVVSRAGTDK